MIVVRCKKHPRYQVKRKPRCLCEPCWALWVAENFESIQRHNK